MNMGIDIAQDSDVAVFACGNRMASYKYIQPGVTEVTFLGGDDDVHFVGHINQLEKAEGKCRHFVETGEIPTSCYSVIGECHCVVCEPEYAISDADRAWLDRDFARSVYAYEDAKDAAEQAMPWSEVWDHIEPNE